MKVVPVVIFLALLSQPAWAAKKRECFVDMAVLGHSKAIDWSPGAVDPKLATATAVMLNSAPNTWVVFAQPEGRSVYQRGYDSGEWKSDVRRPNLTNGAQLALKVLSGTMDSRNNDFSILAKASQSNTYLEDLTASYTYPLAIRGRFAEKYEPTSGTLGAGRKANRSEELPGSKAAPDTIEAMGLFLVDTAGFDARYVWASNYLHLVDTLKRKGFRFSPGSAGENFYEELSRIWEDRQSFYGSADGTTLPHELRNSGAIEDALRRLFEKHHRKPATVVVASPP